MRLITKAREARGWSKARLAREADMNASTVGAIEAGRLKPYPSQIKKLLRALGFPEARAYLLLEDSTPAASGEFDALGER